MHLYLWKEHDTRPVSGRKVKYDISSQLSWSRFFASEFSLSLDVAICLRNRLRASSRSESLSSLSLASAPFSRMYLSFFFENFTLTAWIGDEFTELSNRPIDAELAQLTWWLGASRFIFTWLWSCYRYEAGEKVWKRGKEPIGFLVPEV